MEPDGLFQDEIENSYRELPPTKPQILATTERRASWSSDQYGMAHTPGGIDQSCL
jgi:hypothetical protein